MRFWRCYNPDCQPADAAGPGADFTAELGVCPKCGLSDKDKKYGGLIVPLVVLHYELPHPVVKRGGGGFLACDPAKKIGQHGRATRATSAVNCPACKATPIYQEAVEAVEVHPDYQVPAIVDLGQGTITIEPKG